MSTTLARKQRNRRERDKRFEEVVHPTITTENETIHQKSQRSHFKRRIKERYGFYITNKEYFDAVNRFLRGEHLFVKESNRSPIFIMIIKNRLIPVLFDRCTNRLVTVFEMEKMGDLSAKVGVGRKSNKVVVEKIKEM